VSGAGIVSVQGIVVAGSVHEKILSLSNTKNKNLLFSKINLAELPLSVIKAFPKAGGMTWEWTITGFVLWPAGFAACGQPASGFCFFVRFLSLFSTRYLPQGSL
jgi:hypothetical protein